MAAATVAEVPAVDDGQQRKGLFHGQTGTKPISATVTEAYRHAGASEAPEIVPWSAEMEANSKMRFTAARAATEADLDATLRLWNLHVFDVPVTANNCLPSAYLAVSGRLGELANDVRSCAAEQDIDKGSAALRACWHALVLAEQRAAGLSDTEKKHLADWERELRTGELVSVEALKIIAPKHCADIIVLVPNDGMLIATRFRCNRTVCLPPVWLYFDPELKHCQAACPKERMLLMLVDGHDDDFIVLPRGGAAVLPMPALLPKDRQNAVKLARGGPRDAERVMKRQPFEELYERVQQDREAGAEFLRASHSRLGPYVDGCCGMTGAMHGPMLYSRPFPALFEVICQQNTRRLTAHGVVKETCKYTKAVRLSSLTPAMVEAISVEEFREMGLRRSQAACVKTVASHFISGRLPAHLGMLDDIDVKNLLLNIKGIGRWTVGKFLQMHAGRPDVLTLDTHTRKAMRALFHKQLQGLNKGRQEDKAMEVLAELLWEGHRTLASAILYHASSHGLLPQRQVASIAA